VQRNHSLIRNRLKLLCKPPCLCFKTLAIGFTRGPTLSTLLAQLRPNAAGYRAGEARDHGSPPCG
jgi:hypothetical protein